MIARATLATRFIAVAIALAPAPAALAQDNSLAGLTRRLEALERRARTLRDAASIRRVQRAFGYYVDKGQWDQAAALFARRGTIELGADGIYVGPERIRAYLSARRGGHDTLVQGQLNMHLQLQPVIHVATDGRTARGRWRELGMEGEYQKWANWIDGVYENEYVKEDGVWKIARLHLFVTYEAPYQGGWAALRRTSGDARSAAARSMPADRPPSATNPRFPERSVAPFHYPAGAEQ